MGEDRIGAISDLLGRAEEAHGAYETSELGGVYDRDWARWYATYVIGQGLAGMLGHEVEEGDVERVLVEAYGEYERLGPEPGEAWTAYVARRIDSAL